jgi:predicted sugar kinase
MDQPHALSLDGLLLAYDALQAAAAELAIASAVSRSAVLQSDARVLADAVERELLAVGAVIARHG